MADLFVLLLRGTAPVELREAALRPCHQRPAAARIGAAYSRHRPCSKAGVAGTRILSPEESRTLRSTVRDIEAPVDAPGRRSRGSGSLGAEGRSARYTNRSDHPQASHRRASPDLER